MKARHEREAVILAALLKMYPAMPCELARIAAQRNSRALIHGPAPTAESIYLIARATTRHQCTDYDARMAETGADKGVVRESLHEAITKTLAAWGGPTKSPR